MNTMPPLVSVIIPTYNSAHFLPTTLDSVIAQTYKNLEVVIVDDGSTDETKEVVSKYSSCMNLKYIIQPHSGGPSRPRNRGIKESSGDFISLFDSDDIMLKDKVERAIRFLTRFRHIGLVFTDFVNFDEETGFSSRRFLHAYSRFLAIDKEEGQKKCYIISRTSAFETLFYENYIATPSVVIPRDVLSEVGYFNDHVTSGDDRDMWFRISRKYDIGFIDMVSFHRRVHNASISSRPGIHLAENRIKVLRKQLEGDLSKPLRRQARKLISQNLYNIGCHYQSHRGMKAARSKFILSLREYIMWGAIRGLIITFIPGRLHPLIKNLTKKGGKRKPIETDA